MISANETNGNNLKCDKRLLESACGHAGFNFSSPHSQIKWQHYSAKCNWPLAHSSRFSCKCEQFNYTYTRHDTNAAFICTTWYLCTFLWSRHINNKSFHLNGNLKIAAWNLNYAKTMRFENRIRNNGMSKILQWNLFVWKSDQQMLRSWINELFQQRFRIGNSPDLNWNFRDSHRLLTIRFSSS